MSCDRWTDELSLYYYGELTQEEEERVEQHLAGCGTCSAELSQLRRLGRAISLAEAPVPDDFLNSCRVDLARTLRAARGTAEVAQKPWLGRDLFHSMREFMNMHVGFSVPAGALALIAVGFLAGKISPGTLPFFGLAGGGAQQAGFVNVRSVEPDASGNVRIAFDNVSRRTVSGSINDPKVRALLLASMRDESNPGLRVEAAGIIKDHAGDTDVRNALLEAVQHDPNVGVRMNAIEGLRHYGSDDAVRKAMTEVLLNDANPGVRVKAIDLLTANKDVSIVGALQSAMQKEDNNYVRMRMTKVLRDFKASVGTF